MEPLEQPDVFHFNAAQGWFELGNCPEALAELDALSPAAREQPAVLELRWQVAVKQRNWEEGVAIADTLCRLAPKSPFGWIHRSYCLHELKRTQEAWDMLLPLVDQFPQEWLVCYNLACYACQLGRLAEAKTWFDRALKTGNPKEIRKLAGVDPDLKPLFPPPEKP